MHTPLPLPLLGPTAWPSGWQLREQGRPSLHWWRVAIANTHGRWLQRLYMLWSTHCKRSSSSSSCGSSCWNSKR